MDDGTKLWSHAAAQRAASGTATPDEQEALQMRYGPRTMEVLVLASGRMAIFRRDFQLMEIRDTAPTMDEWTELGAAAAKVVMSKMQQARAEALPEDYIRPERSRDRAPPPAVKQTNVKSEDLF